MENIASDLRGLYLPPSVETLGSERLTASLQLIRFAFISVGCIAIQLRYNNNEIEANS